MACLVDLSFDMDESLTFPTNFGHQISVSEALVADMASVSFSAVDDDDNMCAICMERFESSRGGNGKQAACGHVYHGACISSWLYHCNSCPLCRFNISVAAAK